MRFELERKLGPIVVYQLSFNSLFMRFEASQDGVLGYEARAFNSLFMRFSASIFNSVSTTFAFQFSLHEILYSAARTLRPETRSFNSLFMRFCECEDPLPRTYRCVYFQFSLHEIHLEDCHLLDDS